MQIDLVTMNADIGDSAPWRHQVLAELEGRRHANRFHHRVRADTICQGHDPRGGVVLAAVDDVGSAKAASDLQPVVVKVDHDDLARREELRRQQGGKADGASADNGDADSGVLHLAVEDTAFKPGRQDVAQQHQRFLVYTLRQEMQAGVGMGNADILGLGPVNGIAQNPTAAGAMRIHAATTIVAFSAGRNAGNQHMIARLEARAGGAGAVDNADAFMAQNPPRCTAGNVALQNMKIGAADCGLSNFHHSVVRILNDGLGPFFQRFEAGTAINQGFHGAIRFNVRVSIGGRLPLALTPINLSGGSG